MKETILSVGIDLGTTTTQMIVSRLVLENTASAFSVPQMRISDREIVYRGGVHFTPLLSQDTLDAEALKAIIGEEYRKAGIAPSQIQTGAVIITGETARKENARAVLKALAEFAGKFVVATAGPALEGVLAARGAGADRYAREHRTYVLHLDIGGGTSNMALFDPEGNLVDTGCVNVGGRLMKFDPAGKVLYRSPVLDGMDALPIGEQGSPERLKPLIDRLVQVLEEAAGLRERKQIEAFVTDRLITLPDAPVVLSFSGGVAELIREPGGDWLRFGDLGVLLGRAIAASRLCRGRYTLGRETLQATVVGAGTYSTELSGSTVDYTKVSFPMQNLPVVAFTPEEQALPPERLGRTVQSKLRLVSGGPAVLAMEGIRNPSYESLCRLAEGISRGVPSDAGPVVVTLREDMAKALGHALRAQLGKQRPVICLDGLSLQEGSYLDIAAPVGDGTALPVVVKTLAFL